MKGPAPYEGAGGPCSGRSHPTKATLLPGRGAGGLPRDGALVNAVTPCAGREP